MMTVLMTIAAIAGWETGKKLIQTWQQKYRWSCPLCSFKIRVSTLKTLQYVKNRHLRVYHSVHSEGNK